MDGRKRNQRHSRNFEEDMKTKKRDHLHCHRCGCVLTEENSYHGTNILCKDCKNKLDREYKKRRRMNPDDTYRDNEKKRAKIYYHTIYQKKRDSWLEAYQTACLKCSDNRPWVLVWHHVDPYTKKLNIGAGTPREDRKAEVIEETKKCVNLCANCHREFHHIYGNRMKHPKESLEEYLGRKL